MLFHLLLLSLQAGRLASHHILDFGMLILDFFNPNSLAQTSHIVGVVYLILVYKKVSNVILKSAPGRAAIRNPQCRAPVFSLLYFLVFLSVLCVFAVRNKF
jgi:hypothetical protein